MIRNMSDTLFKLEQQARFAINLLRLIETTGAMEKVKPAIDEMEELMKSFKGGSHITTVIFPAPTTAKLHIQVRGMYAFPIKVDDLDQFFELTGTTGTLNAYSVDTVELRGTVKRSTPFIDVEADVEYNLTKDEINVLIALGKLKVSYESYASASVICEV